MNKTKIVATIGPAAEKIKELVEMMDMGLDACRLNFSHGDYIWHRNAIRKIRQAEKKVGRKVAIIADIQGPRVRVANKKELDIKKGERIFITDTKSPAIHQYKKELMLDWEEFYLHIKRGDRIFIEDGIFDLVVTKKEKFGCVAEVLIGGKLKPHKGVNIPAISDYLGFLTDKDLSDLNFVCGQDVDMVAVSFVKNRKNISDLRKIMDGFISKNDCLDQERKRIEIPWIISKIERKDALRNLDGIIDESDGIMVARGDLAIEVPQEKVAILQKDIIKKCLKAKKPVIVATQMMASMVENNRPTRAEISDISNAVIDQADAIMFSNETAVGRYPIKVIETADKIIREAERSSYNDRRLKLTNRFARMLFRVKEDKRRRSVKAKSLKELLEYSSLRQEKVSLCLDSRSVLEKRKASLIWGSR